MSEEIGSVKDATPACVEFTEKIVASFDKLMKRYKPSDPMVSLWLATAIEWAWIKGSQEGFDIREQMEQQLSQRLKELFEQDSQPMD